MTIACQTECGSGGDISPHRSTWETKDWCLAPSTTSGTTQLHYFVVAEGTGVMGSSSIPLNSSSYSIEMPEFPSKEPLDIDDGLYIQCMSNDTCNNSGAVFNVEGYVAPGSRHGTEEPEPTLVCAPPQELARPKRRRSSTSMDEDDDDSWNMTLVTVEQPFVHQHPPAKRRRLHTRKPAMEAAVFDAILIRLDM